MISPKPGDMHAMGQRGIGTVQVIVATGFIAKNQAGQVATLKRNGSDYSATIMGALVRSANIVIWTDVDGVFSADPRKVCSPLWSSCCRRIACSGLLAKPRAMHGRRQIKPGHHVSMRGLRLSCHDACVQAWVRHLYMERML